ncbi:chorismate-binding protein [uncultured Psychroserpens sp.]|uniref:chorismate-binding protein n=1 Tax=uncultured Psychroserpens sp. TaxID=255436 RepID=UPI00260FBC19|nr:chorismate-binding protein [uncultured Psychroserpens sp.]
MRQEDFFFQIESHFKNKLPFVAYKKPNESIVKGWFQNNDNVHYTSNFDESGFVFSPFDSKKPTVIFPTESSKIITSEMGLTLNVDHGESQHDTATHFKEHVELVQKGVDIIHKSELEKVVLSRAEVVPISDKNPLQIFRKLLHQYSAAFVYIWYHPKVGLWLGATPETLLNIDGLRFKTMSLAGTQYYVDTLDVTWDSKNIDEQRIVTEFIVNELEPFVDQLNVSNPKTVKAGTLLHLQSQISGILKPNHLKNIVLSLHPTPAVCGLPKVEAKYFIQNNENYDREFYTGFLGELNLKTSRIRNTNKRNVENNAYATIKTESQLFVNLRCMQIKNERALIYVGGGITKDSIPLDEWEETVKKSKTMMSVLN